MLASLALTPVVLVAHFGFSLGGTAVFVLAAAALAPLAFMIGEATENVSFHTGPTLGALANASLGNAPELIIALFAVADGLPQVVLGSITGSVVSTTLLVCGGALIAGGSRPLRRDALLPALGAIVLAVALFCIPAIPGLHGNPQRHELYLLTLPISALLLCVYLVVTARSIRAVGAPHTPPPPDAWRLRTAIAVLAVSAAATAVVSELLVHSLQSFGRALGLSPFFVAVVIVALVGNAAEQGGAVLVARRGNPGLGAEIAVSSATQIALFVCPAVALLSAAVGHDLTLSFRPVELITMAAASLAVGAAVWRGRSSTAAGVMLVGCYGVAVLAFGLSGNG
jgi:Ca2+:H+ antiporter